MHFEPIAIVGRSCLLPGALNPEQLWQAIVEKRNLVSRVPAGRWGLSSKNALKDPAEGGNGADAAWSDKGGYVDGFDKVFNPEGYGVPAQDITKLDPIFQWVLHTGREALRDAGVNENAKTGAIFGNLSFPTSGLSRFAERVWMGEEQARLAGVPESNPANRFMSGLPAHMLAKALGLGGKAYCLDAACASSLYAIKLACHELQDGKADVMLAGAVNRADDLFIHVGFTALQALSKRGESRPFHPDADGLIPSDGAGFVVLKRLQDAEASGDKILGVIRGVGVSNDGRGNGFLAPSSDGQVRAMQAAYEMSGIRPEDVSLVECHATGTTVGDATELKSMDKVFAEHSDLNIGSLKSNMGHAITAAGIAGLLKVLGAMENKTLPPTLSEEHTLDGSRFNLVTEAKPWTSEGTRKAGLSAFGFGGNNAHLILEEYQPQQIVNTTSHVATSVPLAVVGMGSILGQARGVSELSSKLFSKAPLGSRTDTITLPMKGLKFPPNDLKQALGQQLMMLAATQEALNDAGTVNPKDTCVLMGMGCDPEVARYGARWRLKDWAARLGLDKSQLQTLQDEIVPVLESPGVLGTMPNIVANRLSSQFDFTSFGFAISSEELSGVRSLEVAMRALRSGEVNTAVVGAVDVSAEKVHAAALKGLGHDTRLADGAVTLVLERLDDAQKAGRKIYAILEDDQPGARDFDSRSILERVGKPHAASGLLEISTAILALVENHHDGSLLRVSSSALGGQHTALCVRRPEQSRTIEPLSHSNEPTLSFSAHLPDFRFPDLKIQEHTMTQPSHEESLLPLQPNLHAEYVMQPAPELAAVMPAQPKQEVLATPVPVPAQPVHTGPVPVATPVAVQAASMAMPGEPAASSNPFVRAHQNLANAHARFLNEQARIQAQMMNLQNQARHYLMQRGTPVLQQRSLAIPAPAVQTRIVQTTPAPSAVTPKVEPIASPAPQPMPETVVATPVMSLKQEAPVALETPAPTSDNLPGLKLNREELMIHADGKISEIFGSMFEKQDGFHRQVRMPKPPLLLADRITGLDAEAGSMKNGTIWSETDVTEDAWYMHEGRMPAGIMIESGQADLMLISYLGIDFLNQSDRVYRLLGCELTYHGNLPQPGETLQYDIHVDGYAKQGDVRLFFFHYDCKVNGEPRLTVRGGQAGFFTDKELDDSKGIIWDAETGEYAHDARVDAPLLTCEKTSLTRKELEAYAAGRPQDCFGNGFEMGCTHTASPKIAGGRMLFMDKVTHLENQGGPWKRGYLRGTQKISSDDWFFDGHFKNDSCMPGTLMFEGCLQAMAVYMGSLGYTTGRDGWRFEPVPEETYKLQCRGQVLPTSKELIYEIFVEEVWDGPVPTLFADILCTVDGLKAFHCHRMGLRLVPDWPLEKIAALNPASDDSIPVATVDGFKFDYASLLACAWGKPSKAFGEMYTVFDQTNRVARLPGPPYHFMSRVPTVDGPIGGMKAGTVVEVDYDIPEDVWYFDENGHRTMPFCVLLEAALQPCGWLASYVGSALTSNDELFFRNLDGKGTLKVELLPAGGTLRTRSKITSISQSAGMIIESFEVKCFVDDIEVYEMNTVFGFFPHGALATQKGLDTSAEQFALLTNPSDFHVNLKEKPARYLDGTCRLANDGSLMLDRITGAWPEGGEKGLGRYRSEKDIDQDEWFFKAHFFQDPVQPGSLGIEAMIQLLQVAMLEQGMDAGIENPRFEPIALDKELSWKYRGQVRPHNKLVQVTLDITEKGVDARGPYAIADASLWVDGMRIYSADNIGMRIVNDGVARLKKKEVETLDPARDLWLNDHCPTWTMPVLPMMSMVDRMAAAAASKSGLNVVSMQDVMVKRWVPITKPTELRTEAKLSGDSVFVKLFEQDDVIATAKATVGAYSAAPKPFEALAGAKVTSPYEEGSLFHGPAFQLLEEWVLADKGSSAILNLDATDAPSGHLGQILLDAATHGIVHDNLNLWSKDIPNDQVAYPAWISNLTIHGPKPTQGKVRCETRFDGFVGGKRFPAFVVQLIADGEVWLSFKLVEALFPKGPLGSVSPEARAHFLRDRQYVDGVGLSSTQNSKTILRVADVHESDWLAGTVKAIYKTDEPEQIALKDHLAAKTKIHPGNLPEALPLSSWDYNIEKSAEQIVVSSDGGENLDLSCVKDFWSSWFNRGSWPVEDLFYSLANKFVRRVVLEEPAAMQALKGKSVLYLANHQVGIESLLFSIMASGMFKVPTVTLAKAEHRDTWLGHLIRDAFSYPGIEDPEVIAFFDREDKESLPRIIGELAQEMMGPGKSVMVHVEGTRSLSCTTPVEKMSGAFIDMALKIGVPIVPIRFSGGLPREDLGERIEFPLNMGHQDYHFGKPIMPEELASMPYGERKKLVMAAINGLGVSNDKEVPLPGDSSFHTSVSQWSLTSGVSEDDAVLLQCLLAEPQVSEETDLILQSLNTGKLKVPRGKKGTWLKELAKRLLGSRSA